MSEILTWAFAFALFFSMIRSATPLIFAALGGMFSEPDVPGRVITTPDIPPAIKFVSLVTTPARLPIRM